LACLLFLLWVWPAGHNRLGPGRYGPRGQLGFQLSGGTDHALPSDRVGVQELLEYHRGHVRHVPYGVAPRVGRLAAGATDLGTIIRRGLLKADQILSVFGRSNATKMPVRFYVKRGFVLIRETDGARNIEKEPDAMYSPNPRETR
jgi:hypothetical protein